VAGLPPDFILDPGPENSDANFQPQPDGSIKLVASPPIREIDLSQNAKPCPQKSLTATSVRLKSKKAYTAGKFCADIMPVQEAANGVVFAMYTANRNPGDDCRVEDWDELDLEWLAKDGSKGIVETNVWHDLGSKELGKPPMTNPNAEKYYEAPKGWGSYCIEWFEDGSVKFSVNGVEIPRGDKIKSIGKPWRPMYGYISIWGGDFPGWSGSVREMKKDAYGFVKNVTITGTSPT
jgi:beta-glucanase (GH16 family)